MFVHSQVENVVVIHSAISPGLKKAKLFETVQKTLMSRPATRNLPFYMDVNFQTSAILSYQKIDGFRIQSFFEPGLEAAVTTSQSHRIKYTAGIPS